MLAGISARNTGISCKFVRQGRSGVSKWEYVATQNFIRDYFPNEISKQLTAIAGETQVSTVESFPFSLINVGKISSAID